MFNAGYDSEQSVMAPSVGGEWLIMRQRFALRVSVKRIRHRSPEHTEQPRQEDRQERENHRGCAGQEHEPQARGLESVVEIPGRVNPSTNYPGCRERLPAHADGVEERAGQEPGDDGPALADPCLAKQPRRHPTEHEGEPEVDKDPSPDLAASRRSSAAGHSVWH